MVRIIDTYVPIQGGAIFQPESDPEHNYCLSSGQLENQVRFYNNIIFTKFSTCAFRKNFEIMRNTKSFSFFLFQTLLDI
jgi:hypothetical protein